MIGEDKTMQTKKPGWFKESYRHSLASRGIKTAPNSTPIKTIDHRQTYVWGTPKDGKFWVYIVDDDGELEPWREYPSDIQGKMWREYEESEPNCKIIPEYIWEHKSRDRKI